MREQHTDFDGTESDHSAVNLINDPIDLLEIVRVGDDLVASKDVLNSERMSVITSPQFVIARTSRRRGRSSFMRSS